MARDDPFAGAKLSSLTPGGQLDQRLFRQPEPSPASPQKPSASETPAQPAVEQSPAVASESKSPATKPPSSKPEPAVESSYDLRKEPLYNATFVFTEEELWALEDLKQELHRDLDKKVTKYDLIRTALHMLLEDHSANGSRSYATRKLKKR